MEKFQILCFSSTGNTYYLAKYLGKKLYCSIIGLNDEINCDHLIIMSSIHAFRVPLFLKKKITNCSKLSVIAVGCNDSFINSAAGIHLIKKAYRSNIDLMVYDVLAMPLTIVKKFDVDYGKKVIANSIKKLDDLAVSILNNKKSILKIPFKSKVMSLVHYIEVLFVKLFGLELFSNEKCVNCGLCVKGCPKKNIRMKKKIKFGLNCMMCMKCIYSCPVSAIHPRISKFIEFKDGYDINDYL